MPEPPLLTPFVMEEQQLYSEFPSDVWVPHPISWLGPGTLRRKLILADCIHDLVLLVTTQSL